MARAVVVYESMFGNTEAIARAVAEGLAERLDVEVARAGPDLVVDDVALVVVGAPTHAFGLSWPSTRRSAGEQGAPGSVAQGPGLREWLDGWTPGPDPPQVAAFDTRIRKKGVPGSAARTALRKLHRRGTHLACSALSFWVSGTPGPLLPEETDRAREWGRSLAQATLAHPVTH